MNPSFNFNTTGFPNNYLFNHSSNDILISSIISSPLLTNHVSNLVENKLKLVVDISLKQQIVNIETEKAKLKIQADNIEKCKQYFLEKCNVLKEEITKFNIRQTEFQNEKRKFEEEVKNSTLKSKVQKISESQDVKDGNETETDDEYNEEEEVVLLSTESSEEDDEEEVEFEQVQSLFDTSLYMEATHDNKYQIVKIDKKYTVIPFLKTVTPLFKTIYSNKYSESTFSHKRKEFIPYEDYLKLWITLENVGKRCVICLTGKGLLKLSSYIQKGNNEDSSEIKKFIKHYDCMYTFTPLQEIE